MSAVEGVRELDTLADQHGLKGDLRLDLERQGVLVFRCPEMPPPQEAWLHPRDPHPSPEEYEWVAQSLLDFLASKETSAGILSGDPI